MHPFPSSVRLASHQSKCRLISLAIWTRLVSFPVERKPAGSSDFHTRSAVSFSLLPSRWHCQDFSKPVGAPVQAMSSCILSCVSDHLRHIYFSTQTRCCLPQTGTKSAFISHKLWCSNEHAQTARKGFTEWLVWIPENRKVYYHHENKPPST